MKNAAYAQLQQAVSSVNVKPDYIRLIGGLDEVTPPYERKPGVLRFSLNFEADTLGGYRRMSGYERFNGMQKPSEGTYVVLAMQFTGIVAVGDAITGSVSGATATAIAVTSSQVIASGITGTFQSGDILFVLGDPRGLVVSSPVIGGGSSTALKAEYKGLTADYYRQFITVVPGSDRILNVFEYNGLVYALRNSVSGSTAALWVATSLGWIQKSLGREIAFTSGSIEIFEGDTIIGATSAAEAVVTRVYVQSGTWDAGTAAGRILFASQTGTFVSENLDTDDDTNLATIAGNSAAISLLPNGRYKFIIENFGGASGTRRVYGVDGVNPGFEFDGSVWVQIHTGMVVDAPTQISEHKKQLFFAFGSSAQHSAPGQPYIFNAILGAAEIAVGDDITGFSSQPGSEGGGALAIFSRNSLNVLYGSGVSDWSLTPYRKEVGAYANTIQDVGFTIFLDDRGITDLQTSQNYGNFAHTAISDRVRPSITLLQQSSCASCVSRDRNQYRLFFSTGNALYVTIAGGKVVGITPHLFPIPVLCVWHGETSDGGERIYFGSQDGHVFQMDKGTSFDGTAIDAHLDLAYNFQKSPRIEKHYWDCTTEISGGGYAAFNLGYSLGYGNTDIPQPVDQNVIANFRPAIWDEFVWDEFVWDGVTLMPSTLEIGGDAENISLAIKSNSAIYEPFVITAALIYYTMRRRTRP